MRGFSETERELLAQMARKSKVEGYSLTKVFNEYAVKTKRASGSVRNFYYSLLKENGKLTEGLCANLIKPFDKRETVKLVSEILQRASGGKSIRKVISEMSSDEKEALRLQNKYRNTVKNQRELVEGIIKGLTEKGVACKNPYEKTRKKGFVYHRLQREINGLFEKIAQKEKKINEELREKIKALQEENQELRQSLSPIVTFYKEKPSADDKVEN